MIENSAPCTNHLPPFLYKYLPDNLERLAMIFVGRKLFFPSPALFNDPFDCALGIKFPSLENLLPEENQLLEEYYKYLAKYEHADTADSPEYRQWLKESLVAGKHRRPDFLAKTPITLAKIAKNYAHHLGVLSLSADAGNILMWSHYASAHRGVLLQFETSRLIDADSREVRCQPIKYDTEFPTLSEFMDASISDNPRKLWHLFYCRKHEDWKYENEFRIFSDKANNYLDIPDGMITGLAFGSKTDSKLKQQVRHWLKEGNWSVKTSQAMPSLDSFEIRFRPQSGFGQR